MLPRHWFRGRVQNIAEAIDGDTGLLEILPELGKPEDGLGHLPGDHVEGHELADRQLAGDDRTRTEKQDTDGDDAGDRLHRLLGESRDADDAEGSGHIACKPFLPATLQGRLQRHGLDRFDAAMLSTRKDWFSAPRRNFSSMRCLSIGLATSDTST